MECQDLTICKQGRERNGLAAALKTGPLLNHLGHFGKQPQPGDFRVRLDLQGHSVNGEGRKVATSQSNCPCNDTVPDPIKGSCIPKGEGCIPAIVSQGPFGEEPSNEAPGREANGGHRVR